jgi:hypothetical protein
MANVFLPNEPNPYKELKTIDKERIEVDRKKQNQKAQKQQQHKSKKSGKKAKSNIEYENYGDENIDTEQVQNLPTGYMESSMLTQSAAPTNPFQGMGTSSYEQFQEEQNRKAKKQFQQESQTSAIPFEEKNILQKQLKNEDISLEQQELKQASQQASMASVSSGVNNLSNQLQQQGPIVHKTINPADLDQMNSGQSKPSVMSSDFFAGVPRPDLVLNNSATNFNPAEKMENPNTTVTEKEQKKHTRKSGRAKIQKSQRKAVDFNKEQNVNINQGLPLPEPIEVEKPETIQTIPEGVTQTKMTESEGSVLGKRRAEEAGFTNPPAKVLETGKAAATAAHTLNEVPVDIKEQQRREKAEREVLGIFDQYLVGDEERNELSKVSPRLNQIKNIPDYKVRMEQLSKLYLDLRKDTQIQSEMRSKKIAESRSKEERKQIEIENLRLENLARLQNAQKKQAASGLIADQPNPNSNVLGIIQKAHQTQRVTHSQQTGFEKIEAKRKAHEEQQKQLLKEQDEKEAQQKIEDMNKQLNAEGIIAANRQQANEEAAKRFQQQEQKSAVSFEEQKITTSTIPLEPISEEKIVDELMPDVTQASIQTSLQVQENPDKFTQEQQTLIQKDQEKNMKIAAEQQQHISQTTNLPTEPQSITTSEMKSETPVKSKLKVDPEEQILTNYVVNEQKVEQARVQRKQQIKEYNKQNVAGQYKNILKQYKKDRNTGKIKEIKEKAEETLHTLINNSQETEQKIQHSIQNFNEIKEQPLVNAIINEASTEPQHYPFLNQLNVKKLKPVENLLTDLNESLKEEQKQQQTLKQGLQEIQEMFKEALSNKRTFMESEITHAPDESTEKVVFDSSKRRKLKAQEHNLLQFKETPVQLELQNVSESFYRPDEEDNAIIPVKIYKDMNEVMEDEEEEFYEMDDFTDLGPLSKQEIKAVDIDPYINNGLALEQDSRLYSRRFKDLRDLMAVRPKQAQAIINHWTNTDQDPLLASWETYLNLNPIKTTTSISVLPSMQNNTKIGINIINTNSVVLQSAAIQKLPDATNVQSVSSAPTNSTAATTVTINDTPIMQKVTTAADLNNQETSSLYQRLRAKRGPRKDVRETILEEKNEDKWGNQASMFKRHTGIHHRIDEGFEEQKTSSREELIQKQLEAQGTVNLQQAQANNNNVINQTATKQQDLEMQETSTVHSIANNNLNNNTYTGTQSNLQKANHLMGNLRKNLTAEYVTNQSIAPQKMNLTEEVVQHLHIPAGKTYGDYLAESRFGPSTRRKNVVIGNAPNITLQQAFSYNVVNQAITNATITNAPKAVVNEIAIQTDLTEQDNKNLDDEIKMDDRYIYNQPRNKDNLQFDFMNQSIVDNETLQEKQMEINQAQIAQEEMMKQKQNQIMEFENQNKLLMNQLSATDLEMTQLKSELQTVKDQAGQMNETTRLKAQQEIQEAINQIQQEKKHGQNQLNQNQNQINQLNKEKNELITKNQNLSSQLDYIGKQNEQLNTKINEQENKKYKFTLTNEVLPKTYSVLQSEHPETTVLKQYNLQLGQKNNELTNNLQNTENELNQLKNENQQIKQNNTLSNAQRDLLMKDNTIKIQQLQQEKEQLNLQLQTLNKQSQKYENQLKQKLEQEMELKEFSEQKQSIHQPIIREKFMEESQSMEQARIIPEQKINEQQFEMQHLNFQIPNTLLQQNAINSNDNLNVFQNVKEVLQDQPQTLSQIKMKSKKAKVHGQHFDNMNQTSSSQQIKSDNNLDITQPTSKVISHKPVLNISNQVQEEEDDVDEPITQALNQNKPQNITLPTGQEEIKQQFGDLFPAKAQTIQSDAQINENINDSIATVLPEQYTQQNHFGQDLMNLNHPIHQPQIIPQEEMMQQNQIDYENLQEEKGIQDTYYQPILPIDDEDLLLQPQNALLQPNDNQDIQQVHKSIPFAINQMANSNAPPLNQDTGENKEQNQLNQDWRKLPGNRTEKRKQAKNLGFIQNVVPTGSLPPQNPNLLTPPIKNVIPPSQSSISQKVNNVIPPPLVPYNQINQNAGAQALGIKPAAPKYDLNDLEYGHRIVEYNTAPERQLRKSIQSGNENYDHFINVVQNENLNPDFPIHITSEQIREIIPLGEYLKLQNDQGYFEQWKKEKINALEPYVKSTNAQGIINKLAHYKANITDPAAKNQQIGEIVNFMTQFDLLHHHWKDHQTERFIKDNMNDITYNKLIFGHYFKVLDPRHIAEQWIKTFHDKNIGLSDKMENTLDQNLGTFADAKQQILNEVNAGNMSAEEGINQLANAERFGYSNLFSTMNEEKFSPEAKQEFYRLIREQTDFFKNKAVKEIKHITTMLDTIKQLNTRSNGSTINIALDTRLNQVLNSFKHEQISPKQVYDELSAMTTHQQPFVQRTNVGVKLDDQGNNIASVEPDDIYFQRLRQSGLITVPGFKFNDAKFHRIEDVNLQPNDIMYDIKTNDAEEEFKNMTSDMILNEFLKLRPTTRGNTAVSLKANLQKINNQLGHVYNIELDPKQLSVRNKAQIVESVYKVQGMIAELERNLAYRMDHEPDFTNMASLARTQSQRPNITELITGPVELRPHEEMLENLEESTRQNIKRAAYGNEITDHKNYGKTLSFGSHIEEYYIEDEEDAEKLKHEIESHGGTLYTINLQSGKLFPTSTNNIEVGKRYILVKESHPNPKSVHVAKNIVHGGILMDQHKLFPYLNIRHANDKIMQRIHLTHHHLPRKGPDHEEVMDKAGGSFFRSIAKHISNGVQTMKGGVPGKIFRSVKNELKPYSDIINPMIDATHNLIKGTKNEYNTIKSIPQSYKNTKKAFNSFVEKPNIKRGANLVRRSTNLVTKPVFATAREITNISDFMDKIPGLREGKLAVEMAIPPLGAVDEGARAVKNISEGKYLKLMTDGLTNVVGNNVPFVSSAQNAISEFKNIKQP